MAFIYGIAESWDDFAQFGTNYQWFYPPIHPAFMQRLIYNGSIRQPVMDEPLPRFGVLLRLILDHINFDGLL
ncbi:MAG: hypothetical protein QNJ51_02875 [Calothrix sp. MO_167.B12]|nr:hypothetical protein [Calothrix sp. MO_167.B12]